MRTLGKRIWQKCHRGFESPSLRIRFLAFCYTSFMSKDEFDEIIDHIVDKCIKLKNKYTKEKNLQIDYICIFSHTREEYLDLIRHSLNIGKIVDETKTGPVFKLHTQLKTVAGKAKVLKIRIPDKIRPERGDVDFNTDYEKFKKNYLMKSNFSLIKRERFEMIELKDRENNVLVYFSSIPPSKLLGIV